MDEKNLKIRYRQNNSNNLINKENISRKMSSLTFIGLGLYDEKDISLKGLEAIKKSDIVFAEFYTAILAGTIKEKLENLYSKELIILNRQDVEEKEILLKEEKIKNVAFLTAGDSLNATTHIEILLQAKKLGIKTKIIHGTSIITAASGLLGLQAYKFGKITTVPFVEENYFPTSPYLTIEKNKKMGLHSLVLLDIKNDKYMTANTGINTLLKMEDKERKSVITNQTLICVVARAGSEKNKIKAGYPKSLINEDFGGPMHCLVIPGDLHFMEEEAINMIL